ncbi:MAG: glycosyltransferase family 2 protein [Bacteroidetes bacterium]|nr:MAG: glycosyltransferase family 2 protein [Bacteroidota bacterium]
MMNDFPLVYCVILNLNGRALLLETLDSVLKMTYPRFEVLVVDNGSTDGSQDAVRTSYPNLVLIENGTNLGFGEGNNVGIRYAVEHGAEWVILLNNDIAVEPAMLTEMMNVAISNPNIGILSPKIYFFSEPDTFWYAGGKINFLTGIISHRGIREQDKGQYDASGETEYATGCAFLVKREVIQTVGMFDPVYFPAYTEDADWTERARRAGYSIMYVPKARMWHKVSSFSGGGMTPLKTQLKVEHNLIFFKRYAAWYHWLTIPLCIGAATLRFVLQQILKGNFRIITALFRGFMKAFKKLF